MADRTPRRFTMGDLMILIAGVAAGFAWARAARFEWGMILNGGNPFIFSASSAWHVTAKIKLYEFCPYVASITIAVWFCSLRPPRPRLVRLSRQPGVIAVLAFVLFAAWVVGMHGAGSRILSLLDRAFGEDPGVRSYLNSFYPIAHELTDKVGGAGLMIAAWWLLLGISRRWRPEPTWLDRSGRVLGVYWIAVSVFRALDAHAF